MNVHKIAEMSLGFEKSYIVLEVTKGKRQTFKLKRDKKRFNKGTNLGYEYYMLQDGKRIYVNEIKSIA